MIHFWAPWSQPSVDMNKVLEALNAEYAKVAFIKVSDKVLVFLYEDQSLVE